MSRRNKVNPDHYTTAGRLSPDDLARERRKQADQMFGDTRGGNSKPMPPWMADDADAKKASGPNDEQADESDTVTDTMDDADTDNDSISAEGIRQDTAAGSAGAQTSAGGEDTLDIDDDEAEGAAAQQPQAKPRRNAMGKQGPASTGVGGAAKKTTAQRKTERRKREAAKQTTRTGTKRGARSSKAKASGRGKAAGASGTPRSAKAPRARGSAARGASPLRARRPSAHKTASRGTQKATPKKGTSAARKGRKAKKR